MKTRLGRLTIVALSLALFPPLTIGYGQQTRPSLVATAVTAAENFPVEETTVGQLLAAYRSGKATAHEVTQACIDRIAAYDKRGPYINSLITVNPRALADADRLDATVVLANPKLLIN